MLTNQCIVYILNINSIFDVVLSFTFDVRVGHLGGGSDFEGFSYVIGIPAADFGYMVQKIV
jgi:hypothetical protein